MDILDSRDLQERIDELEDMEEPDWKELKALRRLKEETEWAGWEYGIGFIPVDDFEDYAREFAEDIGAISSDACWPTCCINWEWAADELAQDYSVVQFQGTGYYYREA